MTSKIVLALLVASFAVGTLAYSQKIICRKFPTVKLDPQYFLSGGEWKLLASIKAEETDITITFKPIMNDYGRATCTSSRQLIAVLAQGGQTMERQWDFLPHNGLISDFNQETASTGVGRIVLAVGGPNAYYCYTICTYAVGEQTINMLRCYGIGKANYETIYAHLTSTNLDLTGVELVNVS